MTNSWIEHIRKYAKDNNLSYGCALSSPDCKNTYNKTSSTSKSKKKADCKSDCTTCKTCKINKERLPSEASASEPHKMYDKPIGPKKQQQPYPKNDRLIGPIQNKKYILDIARLNPNLLTGFENGDLGKSKGKNELRAMIKQARFTHGDKVADKLEDFIWGENAKMDLPRSFSSSYYYTTNKKPYQKYDKPIGPKQK